VGTLAQVLEAPTATPTSGSTSAPDRGTTGRPERRPVTGKRKKWHPVKDQSKFEAQLDPDFAAEIAAEVEDGEFLHQCIQCGTCSSVCPVSAYMDLTPRRLIAMTRAGARDDVLHSMTPWVCVSCYACTVECPKRIPITEIMHAMRRISLRERTYPRRFTTPVMTKEFVDMIRDRGRSTESWISMKLYLKTNPGLLLKNASLATRLFRQGRIGMKRASIRGRKDLRTLLKAASS
jgi:quinone-modifying oxidoreductase, subunit QmoC